MVIAAATAAVFVTAAYGQDSRTPRVPEPEAKSTAQPTVGPKQNSDPRTTTGQAPTPVPGTGSPYGARGGSQPGVPNPDRVAPGTPGGQPEPPGN